MLKEVSRFDEAEAAVHKALELAPPEKSILSFCLLGTLFQNKGDDAAAERVHRQGTTCSRGCIDESYYNLGLVLRALRRYREARSCFERAIEIDPHYKEARRARKDVRRALRIRRADRRRNVPSTGPSSNGSLGPKT